MYCIKQRLKETVSDTNLLKLGEGIFEVVAEEVEVRDNDMKNSSAISVSSAEPITFRIISGNGYFTDETFTRNLGTKQIVAPETALNVTRVYIAKNTNCIVAYNNKQHITSILLLSDRFKLKSEHLFGSPKLTTLNLGVPEDKFNFNDFIDCPIEYISMINSKRLVVDVSSFAKFPKLTNLDFNVGEGKINHEIIGDVSKIANLKLNLFKGATRGLFGDISKCNFKTFTCYYSTFKWTERPSTYNIMSIVGEVYLGNSVDKMLIDQAKCVAPTDGTIKTIQAFGTRTSSSDSAVETLKGKGYTISINGIAV